MAIDFCEDLLKNIKSRPKGQSEGFFTFYGGCMGSRFVFLVFFLFVNVIEANYIGSKELIFTPDEIAAHQERIVDFKTVAGLCLEGYRNEHLSFYYDNCVERDGKKICLSKFYGERRYSKKVNDYRPDGAPLEYLGDVLSQLGFSNSYLNVLENTSCVGMALDCLRRAFTATEQREVWGRVLKFTQDNGVGGTALQEALRRLGWKVYYWNPSNKTAEMKKWDVEENSWKSKGHHEYRYNRVMSHGTYWFNKVDDRTSMVGFGGGEPEILKDSPFWIGTANTGYHVFPGTFADVVEAHSTRHITAIDNLEFSHFAPMAKGGGPRWTPTEKYRSGLIAVPPKAP